jgi:hypothetical protein
MQSLRLKLTLYYLAILSAILLIFGIAIYAYLSHSLVTTIDESLDSQVQKLERVVKISTSETGTDPDGGTSLTKRARSKAKATRIPTMRLK